MQAKLSVGHHNITKLLHACNHFGGEKKELQKYQWSKRWQKMAVHCWKPVSTVVEKVRPFQIISPVLNCLIK
jgi:hypothetical protein